MREKIYQICYDISGDDSSKSKRGEMREAIKENFEYWAHIQGSVWLVVSKKSRSDIWKLLSNFKKNTDSLLVTEAVDFSWGEKSGFTYNDNDTEGESDNSEWLSHHRERIKKKKIKKVQRPKLE